MSDATQPMPKQRSVVQWGLIIVLAALVAMAAMPAISVASGPGVQSCLCPISRRCDRY